MVEVHLQLHVGATAQRALPASEYVETGHGDVAEHEGSGDAAVLRVAVVGIALERERVVAGIPVGAEADLRTLPVIERCGARAARRVIPFRVLRIEANRAAA